MPQRIFAQEHQKKITNCWALTKEGKPCPCKVDNLGEKEKNANGWLYIPYCKHHRKVGDEAVSVIPHPTMADTIGNILVANFDLPIGYRFVYWGKRGKTTAKTMEGDDRAIDFLYGRRQMGMIDPGAGEAKKGCVLQFAGSPGPNEWATMHLTVEHFGTQFCEYAGRMYNLIRPVPKGHQIAHQYGVEWFTGRGITPLDIATPEYPMPKRLSKIGSGGVQQQMSGRFSATYKKSLGTFDTEREAMRAVAIAKEGGSKPAQKVKKAIAKVPAGKGAKRAAKSPAGKGAKRAAKSTGSPTKRRACGA